MTLWLSMITFQHYYFGIVSILCSLCCLKINMYRVETFLKKDNPSVWTSCSVFFLVRDTVAWLKVQIICMSAGLVHSWVGRKLGHTGLESQVFKSISSISLLVRKLKSEDWKNGHHKRKVLHFGQSLVYQSHIRDNSVQQHHHTVTKTPEHHSYCDELPIVSHASFKCLL